MRYHIGMKVRVGGKLGGIMTIKEIKKSGEMILVDENATFYFHPGDCTLIPVKEYIQLSLF